MDEDVFKIKPPPPAKPKNGLPQQNHNTPQLVLREFDAWQVQAKRIGGKFAEGYLFGLKNYMKGVPPCDQYLARRTIWAAGYRLGVVGKPPDN